MGQSRLLGLVLLHIHRQITLDVEKIIDRFSKSERCRFFPINQQNKFVYYDDYNVCF
jgi:hypothetical protein